jgi:hypothetical protein
MALFRSKIVPLNVNTLLVYWQHAVSPGNLHWTAAVLGNAEAAVSVR